MKEEERICKEYESEIKNGDKLVIFISEGCPYCEEAKKKLMEMEIPEKMIENMPNEVVEISISECSDVVNKYEIEGTPTFMRIVDGKIVGRVDGLDEEGIKWLVTMKVEKKSKEVTNS